VIKTVLLNVPQKNKQLISLTPLIDVVFILLLFFMLSSTFNKTKQIELTAAAKGGGQSTSVSQRILLHDNNSLTINDTVYSLQSNELVKKLAAFAEANDTVVLAATAQVSIQQLIAVIDQIKSHDIQKLSVAESVAL
jgi:biopolymer transport protein ExbD